MNSIYLVAGVSLLIGLLLGYIFGGLGKAAPQAASTEPGLVPLLQKDKERAEAKVGEIAAAFEKAKIESAEIKKESEFLQTQISQANKAAEEAQVKGSAAIEAFNQLNPKFEAAKSEAVWLKEQIEKGSQQLLNLDKVLSDRFSTLAQKVLEDQNQKFQEYGTKNIGGLLIPLREKLQTFEKQIQDTYAKESTERSLLRQQVEGLIGAQAKLSEDANRLSSALRADVKQQGNWGELVLRKILENSGLREGEEFIMQGEGMGLKDDEGKGQKPDYVIWLEDKKYLVVDSKVTIRSFERFIHAQDDTSREQHWLEYLDAIRNHVDGLSGKHYHTNEKLGSPEYVMMFMPTEASYALLVDKNPDVIEDAWLKRIIPVGPTNLMACLKTVDSVWKFNRQNKNVEKIMDIGQKALHKFADFTVEIEDIGSSLNSAQAAVVGATSKLTGKGGLVSLMKRMNALDVPSAKALAKFAAEVTVEENEVGESEKAS